MEHKLIIIQVEFDSWGNDQEPVETSRVEIKTFITAEGVKDLIRTINEAKDDSSSY